MAIISRRISDPSAGPASASSYASQPAAPPERGTPQRHEPQQTPRPERPGGSVLGSDLTILGDHLALVSQGVVHIEADIRGEVHGQQVTIGRDGSVIGAVFADRVEVHGGVRGSVRATHVALHETAVVEGDIDDHVLSVSAGAQCEGLIRHSKGTEELKPDLDIERQRKRNGDRRSAAAALAS